MKRKEIEILSNKEVLELSSQFTEENNPYICETAGFVPLEVKFKRFELNGQIARLNAAEYTSQDYRDMYMNPDYEIYPDDDLDDIQEKAELLRKHIAEVKQNVMKRKEVEEVPQNEVVKEEKEKE